jgi:hypothetical protein
MHSIELLIWNQCCLRGEACGSGGLHTTEEKRLADFRVEQANDLACLHEAYEHNI